MKKENALVSVVMLFCCMGIYSAPESLSLRELREKLPKGWHDAQGLLVQLNKDIKSVDVSMQNNNETFTPLSRLLFQRKEGTYPYYTTSEGEPVALAIAQNGRHLFVADFAFKEILTYLISDNGLLVNVGKEAKKTDFEPFSLAISPDKQHLFVNNEHNTDRSVFVINEDGSLSRPVRWDSSFDDMAEIRPILSLRAPLPKKWQELQAIDLVRSMHELQKPHRSEGLPEDLETEIVHMALGENIKMNNAMKLERQVVEGGVSSLRLDQLVQHLLYNYDKKRIPGNWPKRSLKQLASRFVDVKRGTLTSEGLKTLDEWTKSKEYAALRSSLETVQEDLKKSDLPTHKRTVLETIKDRLILHIRRRK